MPKIRQFEDISRRCEPSNVVAYFLAHPIFLAVLRRGSHSLDTCNVLVVFLLFVAAAVLISVYGHAEFNGL